MVLGMIKESKRGCCQQIDFDSLVCYKPIHSDNDHSFDEIQHGHVVSGPLLASQHKQLPALVECDSVEYVLSVAVRMPG